MSSGREVTALDTFMTKKLLKFISRAKQAARKKGILYSIKLAIKTSFIFAYYNIFKHGKNFTFRGRNYRYFYHPYGVTWKNDRAVEIPIVNVIVNEHKGKKILEVGNVLSHYYDINHSVIDKYEKDEYEGSKVINQDIVEYNPGDKYDLIVSISTLEHIGWDEEIKDPMKTLHALNNMRRMLKENGKVVVTFPHAYNPYLDKLLKEGKIKFDEMYCLKKTARREWKEASWEEVKNISYNHPYSNTNALIIGIIKNSN